MTYDPSQVKTGPTTAGTIANNTTNIIINNSITKKSITSTYPVSKISCWLLLDSKERPPVIGQS
jgi:hypothetical protein